MRIEGFGCLFVGSFSGEACELLTTSLEVKFEAQAMWHIWLCFAEDEIFGMAFWSLGFPIVIIVKR